MMRQRAFAAIAIAACLYCLGCGGGSANAVEASLEQVRRYVDGPMGYGSTLFSGVFYVGSDDRFDYVAVRHRLKTFKMFKVRLGEVNLQHRTKVGSIPSRWLDITEAFPAPRNPEAQKERGAARGDAQL